MEIKPLRAYSLKPPALQKKFLGRALPQGKLTTYGRYVQLSLANEQFIKQVAENISFEQTLLKQVSLHATELTHMQISDSRLTECDLANAIWLHADFARVELSGCRLTGLHAIESRWQDVLFKNCQAALAQFRFATLKTVRFEDCDLSDADFQGANLSRVAFVNCNLSRAEMSGAKLAGTDLRGCTIEGLHAGWHELQGAIIDPSQALAIVQAAGIIVELPDNGANLAARATD
jgi:uncharacterized protein YjbI with pentapeptide repeats